MIGSSIQFIPSFVPAQILFSMGMPKSIGSIPVDAFTDEDHHSTVTVTTMPVEDGSTISDNAVEEPDELLITGICGPASLLNLVTSLTKTLDADQALYALKSARQPIQVVTGLRVYTNMVIYDYRVRRNKDTGNALVFTIWLRQIVIIKSQTTLVPAGQLGGSANAQLQVQNTLGGGNQPGVQPTDPIKHTVQNDFLGRFGVGERKALVFLGVSK